MLDSFNFLERERVFFLLDLKTEDFFENINYNEGCIIHTSEEDKINQGVLNKVLLDLIDEQIKIIIEYEKDL